MCLGVPGQIVSIEPDPVGMTMGQVRIGEVIQEICLAYVPEARVGDFVVAHLGFAVSRIEEAEAHQALRLLEELGETDEQSSPRATGSRDIQR
jgi:hydrogenase expression/formation protein HypC